MTRKLVVRVAIGVVAVAAIAFWWLRRAESRAEVSYRVASVERRTVSSTVSATGTLSAVRTVEVGTQASGQVAALYADFNDHVRKGQLIARIDPTLQQQAVAEALADSARAQAQLDASKSDFDRATQLHQGRIITDAEFETTRATYLQNVSGMQSATIAVARARRNLDYTMIYSPVDGVIVERDVDVGQTVAASLQAPKLFVIANDLTRMQILASVDESDIGRIRQGQSVSFTVQSYPGETFTGNVSQVRLASETVNNVVSYTVVVGVGNPKGELLPGMTATVTFICATATDALTVPNAALRFHPTESAGAAGTVTLSGGALAGGEAESVDTVWVLDARGQPSALPVRIGLTDGARTQIDGTGISPGLRVIIGTGEGAASSAGASRTTTTNPLQPTQRRGGPPGPF